MSDFFVYILECSDNSYYIGHTDNLETRLAQHQERSYKGYTSSRLPVKLVFLPTCGTRNEAFEFERKIKKWTCTKKEALINNNFDLVKCYAKKKF